MSSQTFFKLTTLLSAFVFLSGIAMEPQKRSMDDIYAEIRTNTNLYSETYQLDLSELIPFTKSNNFANAIAILEEMADNTSDYTQADKNNLLSFVQSYATELYSNELIGFNPFGTLAKYKNALCWIHGQCTPMEIDTLDTEQPVITKKSRRPIKKNALAEKTQMVEPVDNFASNIQTNIDTIRQARILAHFHQDGTSVGDITLIKNSIKQWFAEFFTNIKKALIQKDENLLNRLWHANFNTNALQFKSRELEFKDLIIKVLQKDNIDEASIKWFTSHVAKLVYKKETKLTLKSKKVAQQKIKPVIEPILAIKPTPEAPKINVVKQITDTLARLNNATELDNVMGSLEQLPAILNSEDMLTLKEADMSTITFNIDESIRRIYQNCLLGLYGNHEQKLQLHIFDTCTDTLITFNTQLRKQLKESDKVIDTYLNNANKRKQACLYEIKVIRDAEKIATAQDIKTWETVIQDRLSSQLEGQNASAIQKTIEANFDSNKNPLLAEQYENIVPAIYNQKNTGKTWPVWLAKNKQIFEQPKAPSTTGNPDNVPGEPMPFNILQTCKDHWMLGSLAVAAMVTGIYYVLEQCYAQDEDDLSAEALAKEEDQSIEKEESKEETAEEPAATHQENKENTAKTKTA